MPMNATRARAEPGASPPGPRLTLNLQRGERVGEWPVPPARLRRWVQLALACDAELSLRLVARAEARALNLAYRRKDYAPNVLTFTYPRTHATMPDDVCRADIVICIPVAREEARRQHKAFDEHLAHLVIHGTLHAQGHDHLDDAQALAMESLETRLLARLRIADPYATAAGRRRLD